MSGVLSYIRHFFSNVFKRSSDTENCDSTLDVFVSSPAKRLHDENSTQVVCLKRRKLDSTDSGSSFSSSNDEKMSASEKNSRRLRSNARRHSGNLFELSGFSNTSNTRTQKLINNCSNNVDDNVFDEFADCRVMFTSVKCTPANEVNHSGRTRSITTRQGSSQAEFSFPSHMCHRTPSCLDRIHQEREKATYSEIVKKSIGASSHKRNALPLTTSAVHNTKQNEQITSSTVPAERYSLRQIPGMARRTLPLTTSAMHNTKQNKNVTSDRVPSHGYFLRPFQGMARRSLSMDPSKETVSDKTVIDLTSAEDDDDHRQIIERNVKNSAAMKNYKTSFIGRDVPQTSPEFLTNMLRKYNSNERRMASNLLKTKQELRKKQEDINKSLVEIVEKKLVLKEYKAEEKWTIDLAPIINEMREEIRRILSSGKTVLAQIKDTGIQMQDIYTLQDSNWLNDEIINAYMNLIKMRSEDDEDSYPKVHCFNTFFYPQLLSRGYSSVRRWTKKIDIFNHTIIIVPIHLGNHWCLAEIRIEEKLIKYYDSFGSSNSRCLETMIQYLIEEYKDKKGGIFDSSDWKLINVPRDEIPNQKNAYDCGVFACTYAEHITRGAGFMFTQEHMNYFREKMIYEILTGKLLL